MIMLKRKCMSNYKKALVGPVLAEMSGGEQRDKFCREAEI